MLVFSAQNLAFLAVPKTGTTAIELALKSKADIIFTKNRKHVTAQRFHNQVAPFLATAFDLKPERIAVMREPEEQLRSWFRYRKRTEKKGSKRSTQGLTFEAFVKGIIGDTPPAFGGVGSQFAFLTSSDGQVLVHRIFAYERQPLLQAFLEQRFDQTLEFARRNVSPPVDAELSDETRDLLHKRRANEFALYDRVMAADGQLVTSLG